MIADGHLSALDAWKQGGSDRVVLLTSTRPTHGSRAWSCELWDQRPVSVGVSRRPSAAIICALLALT